MSTVKSADPCKIFACKLQTCLKNNVYQPSKCEDVIEELRKCCIKHSSISLVCEGIDTSKPYEHNTVDYKETLK
ncbi:cx9C motif-containing protein 4 isoform X1 [Copidosoma floridanum]|uniref:cx9C motif-containing protein 4 isoform X1 n=1 Tax=Copidosoma floridanum TaxID=29053 RepID=UPI0006C9464E|nr:cx9C motif-containing protein 4 isoform X1 [Copidosoma floridanum]